MPTLSSLLFAMMVGAAYFAKFPIIFAGAALCGIGVFLLRGMSFPINIKLALPYFLLIGATLLSGFLIGGVAPSDIATFDFWDGEGRFFLAYMIFLPFMYNTQHSLTPRIVIWLFIALTGFTFMLAAVWVVGVGRDFLGDGGQFLALFTHHTGASSFFLTMLIVLVIYGESERRWLVVGIGFSLLLPIVLTGSRQSLLAAFAFLALRYATRLRGMLILGAVAVPVMLVAFYTSDSGGDQAGGRFEQLLDPKTWHDAEVQLSKANWTPNEDVGDAMMDNSGEWNILGRILFYAYAIRLIEWSPILGVGFGRFNDPKVTFTGIKGFLYFATGGDRVFKTLSAHNSYLHLLAEQGIVGLSLLAWFWLALYSVIRQRKRVALANNEATVATLCTACQFTFIVPVVGGMFGHAFATPSFIVPILALIGYVAMSGVPATAALPTLARGQRALVADRPEPPAPRKVAQRWLRPAGRNGLARPAYLTAGARPT